MVGENGVALGEGKDNWRLLQNDANLLLNKKKNKAQFLELNSICLLYEPIEMLKLNLELKAGRSLLNHPSVGKSVSSWKRLPV